MNSQETQSSTNEKSTTSPQPTPVAKGLMANPVIREIVSIGILILIIVILRSSVFNFYVIPTGSMIPTIKANDRVFANMLSYGLMLPLGQTQIVSWSSPQRGDIVLFRSPQSDTTFVKRVIGVEGDRLSFRDGQLVINDAPVKEEELNDRSILSDLGDAFSEKVLYMESGLGSSANTAAHYMLRGRNNGPTYLERNVYVVPPGKIFCMGDNRDGSSDSRIWGFVDANKVYGRALFILWSTAESTDWLPKFRFERFFKGLN